MLFAPIALVGGVLAFGFCRAAGEACSRRDPYDFGRGSAALNRLWLWVGVAMAVMVAFCVGMVVAAMLTGEWPG